MENTLVVLLLLCALSVTEGAPSQNHPDILDFITLFGDMKAQLAEDRLMIQQLQKDKEELEAKLKEQDSQLEPMKEKLKDQEDKLKELETLKDQQKDQEAKLKELEMLNDQQKVRQVAFSASLTTSEITLGPYGHHSHLIFKHVISNIGNAYKENTGVFTAPVKGAYHFEFYIGAAGGDNASGVALVKNKEHVVIAWEHQNNGYGSSANGATLELEAGDAVFLRLWHHTRIYDNENRHSTFSGRLLFPM